MTENRDTTLQERLDLIASAKRGEREIAALWPDYVTEHQPLNEEMFAAFMAEQAEKRGWSILQAFTVDYHFQCALTEYWEAREDD